MGKVTKIIRKTASVMLASVMAGSACYAPVMAAPATGTSQSFSLGRVGTILDSVKDLISGDKAIEKDSHKKADTFASKRLIVKADKLKNIDKKKVIASYDGYYLLKYKSKKDARKAYEKYSEKSNGKTAIAADQPVHMATGSADAGGLTNVTKKDNPLAELKDNVSDITKAEVKKAEKKKVIALLDTGASRSSNVIESVSMLGGSGDDGNGHGEAMVKAITKENKKAQIISIKVLDKNGEGSVSSIVSGIAYAEKRGASIVNLSLSGLATDGNAVVTTAVNDAIRKGLIVVGAAGNNARDAKFYIPGSIPGAIIVGACDAKGKRIASSNYGDTVDYNAVANSTSEAAALMSGYLSANMKDDGSYDVHANEGGLFFKGENSDTLQEDKCDVTIAYINKAPDIEAGLYASGTLLQTLGKSTGRFEAKGVKTNSIKVSSKDYAVCVVYPNGTAQYFTDKNFVIDIPKGNCGEYTISSLNSKEELDAAVKASGKEEHVYKNPFSPEAMTERNANAVFRAQSDALPDTLTGYISVGVRESHKTFPILDVHIDGHPEAKWKGGAHCIDNHAAAPDFNGQHYHIVRTFKGAKIGKWQWYKIRVAHPGNSDTVHGTGHGDGWQRLEAQVALPDKTIPKTSRSVVKKWVNHDKDPVKVRLRRYKSGKTDGWATDEITLSDSKGWTYTKEDLPKETDDGKKLTYKWKEISKFKGVNTKITSSGTTDTIKNETPTPHPTPTDGSISLHISKVWMGDEEADNIEILARANYTKKTYNVDKDGNRTTLAKTESVSKDYTLNAGNNWKADDSIHIDDVQKESFSDYKWYEQGWRYSGESAWRDGTPPGWVKGDAGAGYVGKSQGIVNVTAPFTKMSIGKEWARTATADSIVEHLYGDTPEGTVDFGTVTLTEADGWAPKEINNLPVYYTRNQLGVLDYHIPIKYNNGYEIDEATAAIYKVKYRWVEEKETSQGHDVGGLVRNSTMETEQPDESDYASGGNGENVNDSVNPRITSYAVDASTGTKAAKISVGSDGTKYMDLIETVNIWDVSPNHQYTLTSSTLNADGTRSSNDFVDTTFIPNQINTFRYEDARKGTFVSLSIKLHIMCTDGFDPTGKAIVVSEELTDDEDNIVASEFNPNNKDQTVYYPSIKTHMVSDNPLNDLAHKYDGTFDSDGKHYGATAENESDRGITLSDTVAYKNLYSGSYIIRGELHRKDRNSDHDFGVVATSDSGTFNVNAGDGVTDGSVTVRYSFNYTDDMFGSDFVSYERLYYVGNGHNDDLTSHADINDKSQTVRMPTRIRIIKKDQHTDQAQPHALIGLYTKDANGDLHEYMHNGKHYVLETDNNGVALFCNLDPGEYWFKELKTSEGHNLMATPFSVNAEYYKTRQMILGEQTTLMLTTGGSGTTMYYIAAGIVAAGCAAAYVIKKRKQAK